MKMTVAMKKKWFFTSNNTAEIKICRFYSINDGHMRFQKGASKYVHNTSLIITNLLHIHYMCWSVIITRLTRRDKLTTNSYMKQEFLYRVLKTILFCLTALVLLPSCMWQRFPTSTDESCPQLVIRQSHLTTEVLWSYWVGCFPEPSIIHGRKQTTVSKCRTSWMRVTWHATYSNHPGPTAVQQEFK